MARATDTSGLHRIAELRELDHVSVRVFGEERVDTELRQAVRCAAHRRAGFNQSSTPRFDLAGHDADHHPAWFDHAILEFGADADACIGRGTEDSCWTLVANALEPQRVAVERARCIKITRVDPHDLAFDVQVFWTSPRKMDTSLRTYNWFQR